MSERFGRRASVAATACLAVALGLGGPSAGAQAGVVFFGEVAPAASDLAGPVGMAQMPTSSVDADCPSGAGGADEAGGDLDCGRGSDARRTPRDDEFGNWTSKGSGANTALGRGALASGPGWTARQPVKLRWHHETDSFGRTSAIWADGARAACVRQLGRSPVGHPDPEASCKDVRDGEYITDADGKRIWVSEEEASTLNERVAARMEELELLTDRRTRYFDQAGNPISSPSDLSWNTAVGADADARGYRSSNIALGHGAQAWGHGEPGNGASNIAIGQRADASGAFSRNVAIGTGANASGEDTENVAIGAGASASGNSVAIGSGVRASDNEVRIGNRNQTVVIGGLDMSELWRSGGSGGVDDAAVRRLNADVAANSDMILANTDAIATNTGAIAANAEAIAANTEAIAPLVEQVGAFDERINRANATAAALSAVPSSPVDKNFMIGVGLGGHESETAIAVGASGRIGTGDKGGLLINGGMANSGDGTTVRVGVGFLW